jgi:hypothetical protein
LVGVNIVDNSLSDGFAYNQTLQKPWVILKLNEENSWMPVGPFSEKEVKDQLKSGVLKPTDYCWISGWTDWKRIYLEPKFYLSRKAPLEFDKVLTFPKTLDKKNNKNDLEERKSIWSEIALKISPKQYLAWKYKKNVSDNKNGAVEMLEPWESKTKDLDFVEEQTTKNEVGKDINATGSNYPTENIDLEKEVGRQGSSKVAKYILKAVLVLGIVFIFSLISFRLYTLFTNQNQINYSMSYFVVEDYMNELPEYLYARTDLKKNQQIKIRVFDLSNKQMRTKNSKAGLMLTSKGNGRMRIPMYAYALNPGVYKVMIEVEDQVIEKEFSVSLKESSSTDSTSFNK